MGTVFVDITLVNVADRVMAKNGHLSEQDIRMISANVIVDTGAVTLIISEPVREKLGLGITDRKEATLANNAKIICRVAEPVEIRWKRRVCVCQPWVLPGDGWILLGAIPLEDMDLMVDPRNQVLVGRHGEEQVGMLYGAMRGNHEPASLDDFAFASPAF